MVSNLYIDDFLKDFHNFKGTFSSDNIPLINVNESIICNFSKVNEEGTHFILIFRKKKSIFYFDPIKLGYIPEDIIRYLSNYNMIKDISVGIQNIRSQLCGYYCILAFLSVNISCHFFLNNVIPCFIENRLSNDEKCPDLINEIYPISLFKHNMI